MDPKRFYALDGVSTGRATDQSVRATKDLMNKTKLNITKCHSKYPNCKVETDFIMFESGVCGDFKAYIGDKTETVYRIDMHKINYLNKEIENLLMSAIEAEGGVDNLRNIPNQVVCKTEFYTASISISGETKVKTVEL